MRFSTCSRSISDSIVPRMCSKRSRASPISRSFCFSSFLKVRCAATVSAKRAGVSIPLSEVRTSGGILELALTYCSNTLDTVLTSASDSWSSNSPSSIDAVSTTYISSTSTYLTIDARETPSTNTLNVPSGNFSN